MCKHSTRRVHNPNVFSKFFIIEPDVERQAAPEAKTPDTGADYSLLTDQVGQVLHAVS